jgi:hypothetical protein
MKNIDRKFKYLEIVKIKETFENNQEKISGLKGTILGYDFIGGEWFYTIDFKNKEMVYSINESDLLYTGLMNKVSDFYSKV